MKNKQSYLFFIPYHIRLIRNYQKYNVNKLFISSDIDFKKNNATFAAVFHL
jgi:hypothetical protein